MNWCIAAPQLRGFYLEQYFKNTLVFSIRKESAICKKVLFFRQHLVLLALVHQGGAFFVVFVAARRPGWRKKAMGPNFQEL